MIQTANDRDEEQEVLVNEVPVDLRSAAWAASKWDVVHRPSSSSPFRARVVKVRDALLEIEREVSKLSRQDDGSGSSSPAIAKLRELRENPRLLRAAISPFSGKSKIVDRLPRVAMPAHGEEPRIAAIANLYLSSVEGQFSAATFSEFIRVLQEHEPLTLDELWNAGAMMQFVLLEMLVDEARALLNSTTSTAGTISTHLNSLRIAGKADWVKLIEPLIAFDETLRQDPANAYAQMDFESRELYRNKVAHLARHSDSSEPEVARMALTLALKSRGDAGGSERMQRRRAHVGYYLIDKGLPDLAAQCGYHAPFIERVRRLMRANPDYFYITAIQLLTVFFVAALIIAPVSHYTFVDCLVGALLLVLPASQCAVDLINTAVTAIFDPQPLPKLDFRKGIPFEFTTLVAVPTLLMNEEQVRGLVTDLEIRYLASRDAHLHFALLTDLPDSVARPHENDSHPLVDLAVHLIDELNAKYSHRGQGSFLLLHRHRVFNRKQGAWMGWERKRGKLLDLNKLLVGDFDAFPIKAGHLGVLGQVRYVLTLDSDSQLPRGAAARLVGAIAHPLNQAIVDPRSRIVTAGYGILQPRIGVTVQSASRSRLAAIFSGQSGFDVYARAVSDAYQELYGEGIFTGKGIYEVSTFHSVLDRRFPRNALLSHDLIEGAYVRAGLATDVELIDDYPSHYSAFTRRKHRWLRGDWQIARWMLARVPEEAGHHVANPISEVSRWKIFDNLRRSLVEPFTFILIVAGWLGLRGGPLYWTSVALILLFFPTLVQLIFGLSRALATDQKGAVGRVFAGFGQAVFLVLLNLVFLPHQALLALDAIIRSLVRAFITGERLLEWETAAQSESRTARRTPVDRYLALTPLVAIGTGVLVYAIHPHGMHIFIAAPVLLLWALADAVTAWLNAPPREENRRLNAGDRTFLLDHGLRIWRYFQQFGGKDHNFLIPDNVEEDGLFEAARVSPTNVGLLLNARQAAVELGFLTLPEFVSLTSQSLSTIGQLQKHRGHLFNWYNTQTLETLAPRMVSSVDSGNFVASLHTLHAGAMDLQTRPLLPPDFGDGLRAFWRISPIHEKRVAARVKISLPQTNANASEWIAWLVAAAAALSASGGIEIEDENARWWLTETGHRIAAILALIKHYLPWLLPEYASLQKTNNLGIGEDSRALTIEEAIEFSQSLETRLNRTSADSSGNSSLLAALRESLPLARQNLRSLAAGLRAIAASAERLAAETEFGFLVHPDTQMLSIGYDAGANRLHDACYDMLASEARIATFLAIARGDLPQESWFKLSRDHAMAFDRLVLLSWTGTMFEYLMPALWMRSYPHTLIAKSLSACVQIQREFGASLNIPWGISESGFARKDDCGHYSYQAFGVPAIALKSDASAGPVVSPYSSFLALVVDSLAAMRNLRGMESAGWLGAFGFYESVDFTAGRGKPVPVREWMAHHQGMSLLAVLNLLRDDIAQQWFHSSPLLKSAELILHETPIPKAVLRARAKELSDSAMPAA